MQEGRNQEYILFWLPERHNVLQVFPIGLNHFGCCWIEKALTWSSLQQKLIRSATTTFHL